MKKSLAAITLAGMLTLSAGVASAQAAPYPAPPSSTVSSGTVTPGGSVVFSASGFTPGESITITVVFGGPTAAGVVGGHGGASMSVPMIIKSADIVTKATAAADGSFSTNITLTDTGTYTLTATGDISGVTASQVVRVVAATGDNGSGTGTSGNGAVADDSNNDLASTGFDTSVLVWSLVGAGALAAGAATVVVSRRRSRQNADA
ncbi:LPXTG cell wall anchor domain-containing protein [Pseudarthrobacter sp. P1]|uniref:LPXTG cell wall anchor domain-containing protein n=1 Tax=Pseudarthrobacter sp. P1 TaxID=3418418 RepID=UPI003CE7629E